MLFSDESTSTCAKDMRSASWVGAGTTRDDAGLAVELVVVAAAAVAAATVVVVVVVVVVVAAAVPEAAA